MYKIRLNLDLRMYEVFNVNTLEIKAVVPEIKQAYECIRFLEQYYYSNVIKL